MIGASSSQGGDRASVSGWIRTGHRWISMLFIATVAANFVAMPFGSPPDWLVYLPLLPLMLLLVTGSFMLARHYLSRREA
jgi:hypothetical protein